MKLIPKHRHNRPSKAPRISISEAEIAADLLYPARPSAAQQRFTASRREAGR